MLSITVNGADEIIADFKDAPQRTMHATVRALNRAMASGRTVMVREIARDAGLKATDVRDALRFQQATFSHPVARLAAGLKRIPLIDFRARGAEPSRGRGHGVSYRLPGGRGRHPHAFIATMGTGHRGVFVRVGKARLSIKELFGPSLGRIFAKHRPAGLARALEVFETAFAHELAFRGSPNAGAD